VILSLREGTHAWVVRVNASINLPVDRREVCWGSGEIYGRFMTQRTKQISSDILWQRDRKFSDTGTQTPLCLTLARCPKYLAWTFAFYDSQASFAKTLRQALQVRKRAVLWLEKVALF
jgi:hypothetical protein